MDLKQLVLSKVETHGYYQWKFPDWHQGKGNVICPFHEEKTGSLSINLDEGGAHCFGCGLSFGNIVHFESKLNKITEAKAAENIYKHFLIKEQEPPDALFNKIMKDDMGIEPDWSAFFGLSWDSHQKRVNIPIQDAYGFCINIRKYQPKIYRQNGHPKIRGTLGCGVQLFPWQCISEFDPTKPVFFLKAEKDTMLANQKGLQAFCTTGGEQYWNQEWNDIFTCYRVWIWHDQGEDLTEKLKSIQNAQKLEVPYGVEKMDFHEWVFLKGRRAKDILNWVEKPIDNKPKILQIGNITKDNEESILIDPVRSTDPDPDLPLVHVSNLFEHINRKVRVHAIVAGKVDRIYCVPNKYIISSLNGRPPIMARIDEGRDLIQLINWSDEKVEEQIKKNAGIRNGKFEIKSYVKITDRLEIIPIASVDGDEKYLTQSCYYIGDNIESNVPYELEIKPTASAKTQEVIGVITAKKTLASSIDRFAFNEDMIERLQIFKQQSTSKDGQETWKAISNVANSLVQYTRIHSRLDWHLVAMLTWTSPLQFIFPNEGRQRGWMNSLVIGDTETGKSVVTKTLREVFNCGHFISAENCSYMGLVGGCVASSSKQWMLRWGRIPLCDRQLVIIEELSGLSTTEIANLSDVRSSGIARLDKGGITGETRARTRLICLSNARSSKGEARSLSSYLSGVKAIQKLIGQPEDISRFDLITTLIDTEVNSDIINANYFVPPPSETPEIPKELWRDLISFIWALKDDQIHITKEAYDYILVQTQVLGRRYHSSIPLFKPSSGRHKIARVACSIACALFAWYSERGRIEVEKHHVEAAVEMLKMLYDKPSMGYKEYSENAYFHEESKSEIRVTLEFKRWIVESSTREDLFSYFIHSEQFTVEELCAIGCIQIYQANNIVGKMVGAHLLDKVPDSNLWRINHNGRNYFETEVRALSVIANGKAKLKLHGRMGVNGKNGNVTNLPGLSESRSESEREGITEFERQATDLATRQDLATKGELES